MNDQELIARAREVARTLSGSRSDLGRLAGELLKQMADRLDAAQVTEASDQPR